MLAKFTLISLLLFVLAPTVRPCSIFEPGEGPVECPCGRGAMMRDGIEPCPDTFQGLECWPTADPRYRNCSLHPACCLPHCADKLEGHECGPAEGACGLPRVCAESNSPTCPVSQLRMAQEFFVCRSGSGCLLDSVCNGMSYDCPERPIAPEGMVCGTNNRPEPNCFAATFVCDGVSATCPNDTAAPEGTFCGMSSVPDCPYQFERYCLGNSTVCPPVTTCQCPPGEYGLDCSCRSALDRELPQSWGLQCKHERWDTKSPLSIANVNSSRLPIITKGSYFMIHGNFTQDSSSELVSSFSSHIYVLGDVKLGGRLTIQVNNAEEIPSPAIWALNFATNVRNSKFDTVRFVNFAIPSICSPTPVSVSYYPNQVVVRVLIDDNTSCN